MSRFLVLSGSANVGGRDYHKDDVIETSMDLDLMYVNKFQRVSADGRPVATPKVKPAKPDASTVAVLEQDHREHNLSEENPLDVEEDERAGKKKVPAKSAVKAADPSLGLNVTKRFETAVENDFKVYKRQGQYFVYDAADLDIPLNAEGVSRDGVEKVVKKALR